jgi:hypothetical protein
MGHSAKALLHLSPDPAAISQAHYELAIPGSLRLAPPAHRLAEIERDYERMADMSINTPLPFSRLIDTLGKAEAALNRG